MSLAAPALPGLGQFLDSTGSAGRAGGPTAEQDDGSPVPDMLKLEGQEEVEEDNFDVKGQSAIAFGRSLDEVAQDTQIGALLDEDKTKEAKEDLA